MSDSTTNVPSFWKLVATVSFEPEKSLVTVPVTSLTNRPGPFAALPHVTIESPSVGSSNVPAFSMTEPSQRLTSPKNQSDSPSLRSVCWPSSGSPPSMKREPAGPTTVRPLRAAVAPFGNPGPTVVDVERIVDRERRRAPRRPS